MSKREWISVGVAGVVLIILAVVLVSGRLASHSPATQEATGTIATNVAATEGSGQPASPTYAPVPTNITVPSEGALGIPADVAVPQIQVAASKTSDMQYRSFSIIAKSDGYNPSTIIVNKNDIVDLQITAVGGNSGFTQPEYGYNVPLEKGKTSRIQFQAVSSGKFTFYCASCGGPAKGPVGFLIVK